jgi:hypothetical protein
VRHIRKTIHEGTKPALLRSPATHRWLPHATNYRPQQSPAVDRARPWRRA